MIILGINAYHPDAAIALMKEGQVIWAGEEERFSRVKHASGFPALALKACFKESGCNPNDIDAVGISRDPRANLIRKLGYTVFRAPSLALIHDRVRALYKTKGFVHDYAKVLGLNPAAIQSKFFHVEHHRAHVASAFYLSGFDKAAFLSIDGMGDFSSAMWGVGEELDLNIMGRVYFPHSAGFLYTAATQFLGFPHFGDEYKVMGLAAYGKPEHLDQFRKMVALKPDGRFELELSYFRHPRGHAKVKWEGGSPEQDILFSSKWNQIFGPARKAGEPITEREKNIASSLQMVLEEIYFHVLNHLSKKTACENLCLAGGVAFNSVANGKITKMTSFKNIYIQPAAGDAGTAIGAAAFLYHHHYRKPREFVMKYAGLGSSYENDHDLENAFKGQNLHFEKLSEDDLLQRTVTVLEEGKIVGWFQGRTEFGPRALGHRSILADPRRADMKDILNERIKNREGFRPFAPMVPVDEAAQFFEMDCDESPFMLKVFPVKADKKSLIPAVTHVDGTARVQTVNKATESLSWKLLKEFGKKTGIPVLLNTSFNESEPIVNTPKEAVNCFLKTKMDVLVLGNYFVTSAQYGCIGTVPQQ